MTFEKINGLIVAPFTPFDKKGEVNLDPIDEYAKLLQRNGLIGVFINGSSGEGYMMTVEERMKIAEKWVSVAPKGFKVIVHCGATCIKDHIPVLNGVYLPMLPFLKAADGRIPNLAGIKYTYEPLYEYNQCMLYNNGKYDMLYGLDETILNALVMGGARGGISGTGSYIGKVLVGIIDEYHKGNIAKAAELQNYAQDVINVIAKYRGNIVCGKRIMKLLGLDLGINRTPFQNITDEEEAVIKKELESIDFFNKCNK